MVALVRGYFNLGGMELQHDDLLTGTPGWIDYERGGDGRIITSADRELQLPSDEEMARDRELLDQLQSRESVGERYARTGEVAVTPARRGPRR